VSVEQIIDDLLAEVDRQDRKHGPYDRQSRLGVSRLAIATLEDEVAEVKDAWREERRAPDWPHTREEVLQVAAVAVRTIRDALQPETTSGGER
jgi:NTP pyrophosphatase (non-canonical NTP hydrolase)